MLIMDAYSECIKDKMLYQDLTIIQAETLVPLWKQMEVTVQNNKNSAKRGMGRLYCE